MTSLDFTLDDIKDYPAYFKRAEEEATLCYNKASTRRGRSWIDVFKVFLMSHAAETYLMENFDYTDDTRLFKDLFNLDGESVEIKTTISEDYVDKVLENLVAAKKLKWRDISNIMYLWIVNKKHYTFYGKYEWDGKEYIQTSTENL